MEWAPAVTAVSTAIIALAVIVAASGSLFMVRHMLRFWKSVERLVDTLDREARPAIDSVRLAVRDATRTVTTVSKEIDAISETSTDLRDRVVRAADAAEDRLLDLEALLDVIQEEVEETVLDVGAALRTTRRGSSILRSMRRAFLGKGRRR